MSEDSDVNPFEEELRADSYTGHLETKEAQIDSEYWQHDPEEWWRDSSNYQRQAMLVSAGITDMNLASFEYDDLSEDIQRQLAEDSLMYSPESKAKEEGTSDGAKKGWLTRKRGGSSEEEPRMETKKNPYDDDSNIKSGIDYDDDEVSDSQSDQDYYDGITQNTMETLQQSTVNGFPFFAYIGQPQQIFKDGKGGVVLYGMKRNPNSVRKVDIMYDEGADTYSVRFVSNRGKVKGEYSDIYFDQLSNIIVGKKGLGVESKANESKASENFTFYEDASHGWLEVPKSLLKELGIADQISSYSYQSGDMAYLEEDADLSLFISKYGNVNTNNPQDGKHIRNYGSYVGESVAWINSSFNRKLDALESLGIKQGDAVRLASVAYEDLSEDLKKDLELPYTEEDAENEQELSAQYAEQDDVDYNNIGESRTARTKYECEHCNCGFKSNESLTIHYNQIHAVAPAPIEGYENWKDVADDLYEKEQSKRKKGGEALDPMWFEKFAGRSGVKRIPVENFLGTIDMNPDQMSAWGNFERDASMYNWNHQTKKAISDGIVYYYNNAGESFHSTGNTDFIDYTTIDEDEIATCDLCGKTWDMNDGYTKVDDIENHLSLVHDKAFESKANEDRVLNEDIPQNHCPECGSYKTSYDTDEKMNVCDNCGNRFEYKSSESLQSTLNKGFDNAMVMDQDDMYRCRECGQLIDIWRIEHELHRDPEEFLNDHLQGHGLQLPEGSLESHATEDYPPAPPEGKKHCPRCGGSGEIDKDIYGQSIGGIYECERCNGDGLVNESYAKEDFVHQAGYPPESASDKPYDWWEGQGEFMIDTTKDDLHQEIKMAGDRGVYDVSINNGLVGVDANAWELVKAKEELEREGKIKRGSRYDKMFEGGEWEPYGHKEPSEYWFDSSVNFGSESYAKEDSLVKIEDNNDDDTQVTVLDEWENETDPDVGGKTEDINATEIHLSSTYGRKEHGFYIDGNSAKCSKCGWVFSKNDGEEWQGLARHEEDHQMEGDQFNRMAYEPNIGHESKATEKAGYRKRPTGYGTYVYEEKSKINCQNCGKEIYEADGDTFHTTKCRYCGHVNLTNDLTYESKATEFDYNKWENAEDGNVLVPDEDLKEIKDLEKQLDGENVCPECGDKTDDDKEFEDHLNAHRFEEEV